jgi:transcription initiation factor TFIIB
MCDKVIRTQLLNAQKDLKEIDIKTDTEKKYEPKKCINCNKPQLYFDRPEGTIICTNCGANNENIIDHSAEWRFYGSEDSKSSDPTRCGGPINPLLPKSSLGTLIKGKGHYHIKRLHSWNSMPYKERSLWTVFEYMQTRCINCGIKQCIIEDSKYLYKAVSEGSIHRGSIRNGIIAASVYYACKKVPNAARSAKEIADIFDIKITVLTKGCKKFMNIVNEKKIPLENINATGINDLLNRFCSKLGIEQEMRDVIQDICIKAEKFGITKENTPPSIVAGSIFMIANIYNLSITKAQISECCIISQVTISKCYKKLLIHMDELVKQESNNDKN